MVVRPPPFDEAIGLGFYATSTPGTLGRLKQTPEDFRVTEISAYPRPDADGPFTVLRVESRNWEQHELVDRLQGAIGSAAGRITWAGTKDRRAVTEQLLSYRGPPEAAGSIDISGIRILESYRARTGVVLGHHYGNSFRLRVTEIPEGLSPLSDMVTATLGALRTAGGFPNFFGPQRFGEVRPVTHRVGRDLVRGDVAAAVETYLAWPADGESPEGHAARLAYASHHDPVQALREFPPSYSFERRLLDHLARGQPPARAFGALSRQLRTLFIHAYQSYLFNQFLTLRHAEGIPLSRPVPGDVLLRVGRDGTVPTVDPVPVSLDNLSEAESWVHSGNARVAGPLVGYATDSPPGRPTDILAEVLSHEGIDRGGFRVPVAPELASDGAWRPLEVPLPPLGWTATLPEGSTGSSLEFSFALPKGVYATVLLREIMKGPPTAPEPRASRTRRADD
ncbi:MAG: tRNA pseudouridine(13) synthase TruD [Thermoplasmata archaeon]|nr:tRNA pseudouridine(13) synthase TruD [Thermoplasmata archaeon]